jgi:hypothetical protein
MEQARKVLTGMSNHFDDNHPLSSFLKAKAGHLLSAPTGHTGILYSFFDPVNLRSHPETLKLSPSFNPSHFRESPGVYIAHNGPSSRYVGSATNLSVR